MILVNRKNRNLHVIGESLSDNIGDQLIAEAILDLAVEHNLNVQLHDLSRHTVHHKKSNKLIDESKKGIVKSKLSSIFRHLLNKSIWLKNNYFRIRNLNVTSDDIIIFGGGQLIMNNGNFPFYLMVWGFLLNKKCKNINLYSVGANEPFNAVSEFFLKIFFWNVKNTYVRDKKTSIILKKRFGISSEVIPDVAYHLYKVEKKEIKDKIAICPVNRSVYEHYNSPISQENYYQKYIDLLLQNKYHLQPILMYSTNDDLQECLHFQKYYQTKHNLILPIIESYTSSELRKNLAKVKILISGRMHMLICGELSSCKTLPVAVNEKIRIFEASSADLSLSKKKKVISKSFSDLLLKNSQ